MRERTFSSSEEISLRRSASRPIISRAITAIESERSVEQCSNLMGKLLKAEGLRQTIGAPSDDFERLLEMIGVSGDQQEFCVWKTLMNCLGELGARTRWHQHIDNNELQRLAPLRREAQS